MTNSEQESVSRLSDNADREVADALLPEAELKFRWLWRNEITDAERTYLMTSFVRSTRDAWGVHPDAAPREIARLARSQSYNAARVRTIRAKLGDVQITELSVWLAEALNPQ